MSVGRGVWPEAIVGLSVLAIGFLWLPVSRIATYQSLNYNEGWNSYRQQMAGQGLMLYALPPDFAATNYPPLSFHFIGFLGKLTGDVTAAGRWVALASLAAIAVLLALFTRQATGMWRLGAYASILFVMWLAEFTPDRVGVNDPHLLGMACSVLGLYLYARNPESGGAVAAAAVAFVTGLFIKQSMIAFPAAVAVHLLVSRRWRSLVILSASAACLAGILLFLTLRWDGSYFWAHLLTPRAYSFLHGWENMKAYLLRYQVAFAAGVFWSIWNVQTRSRHLLIMAFVAANAVGFWFAGGDGVDRNVLFEALAVLAVVTAVAVGDVEPVVRRLRFGEILLAVVLAAPALGCAILLPSQFNEDRRTATVMPELESQYSQAVDMLKARPGPALCEDLLLCFQAGKPMLYDAFFVDSQVKVGRLADSDVARMIAGGQFRTIEINLAADEIPQPMRRLRFTTRIMRALVEHYRPKMRATGFAVLAPKEEP